MSNSVMTVVISVVSLAFVLAVSGCGWYHRPGETSAERARRHNRVLKNDMALLAEDIDQALNLDRVSHLSDKRVQ
ncbi:MAG: hypothetical protein GY809_22825 [Planctomycetes bacterium]|nr:hypothetical protein [Planctomycetota bacterium]